MRFGFPHPSRRLLLLAAATFFAAGSVAPLGSAQAADLKGGRLRVAVLIDMTNFDPMQFSTNNFPLIKNLYDSLIEYTPDGKTVPSLATEWKIAPDNKSVTVTLRKGVKFHSGTPFNAEAVAGTLKKAADPQKGKNLYATMSFVKDWKVDDESTITLNFNAPAPERQITDLLQFLCPIDPAGIDTVETKPAGTGAYTLGERVVGQRIRLVANTNYWREKEPISNEVVLTIFSEDGAATAALESGATDIIYGGTARSAVRLKDAGYQVIQGPGPLVQVFRINSTRGPFRNAKFRQAFNYLMDRKGILKIGYANLGEVVALPWAPAGPAFDATYNEKYAFNIDKAKELLAASGLSAAEMSDWKLLTNGTDESGCRHQPGGSGIPRESRDQYPVGRAPRGGVRRCAAQGAVRCGFWRRRQHSEIPDPRGHEQHLPDSQQPDPRNAASASRICRRHRPRQRCVRTRRRRERRLR